MATAKKTSRATSRKGGAGAKKKAQASGATQEIIGFALMVLGIFSFVAVVMGGAGLLGESIAGVMFGLFGLGAVSYTHLRPLPLPDRRAERPQVRARMSRKACAFCAGLFGYLYL